MKQAPVEHELGSSDSIAVPPDRGTKVRFILLISLKRVVAKDDIRHLAVAVRDSKGGRCRAVINHRRFHAPIARENIAPNFLSFFRLSKSGKSDFGGRPVRLRVGTDKPEQNDGQRDAWRSKHKGSLEPADAPFRNHGVSKRLPRPTPFCKGLCFCPFGQSWRSRESCVGLPLKRPFL